jgi:hypothetical protein
MLIVALSSVLEYSVGILNSRLYFQRFLSLDIRRLLPLNLKNL